MAKTVQAHKELDAALVERIGAASLDYAHRPALHDLFYEVFGQRLCRKCKKDAEFAYLKLKKLCQNK